MDRAEPDRTGPDRFEPVRSGPVWFGVVRFEPRSSGIILFADHKRTNERTRAHTHAHRERETTSMEQIFVTKRDGSKACVDVKKIQDRIEDLCFGLDPALVNPVGIYLKVFSGIANGVTTTELDELAAQTAAYHTPAYPDCALLAGRIAVSSLYKSTKDSFSETMRDLFKNKVLAEDVHAIIEENKRLLDEAVDYGRDMGYDYFGFKTLEKSYLLRIDGRIVERPQHMLMRVAVGIHKRDMTSVLRTYEGLSTKRYTHATPTLFNSGTVKNQMSSCYLLTMREDSIEGIFETLGQCAKISKYAGGIGLSVSNVRATGSYIEGTNGTSNGLVPMLQCFNATARYSDQGGGKRKGSFAIYLECFHPDIMSFLDMKKNHGPETERARDLFYALWVSDIFMRRVEADGEWTLICPTKAPDLIDLHGPEFDKAYERYEDRGVGTATIKARVLWTKIVESQIETGVPYILFKDACNAKSNQQNLGTIRSSNLCAEVVQFSSRDEIAVCNLASINLLKHVRTPGDQDDYAAFFDFDMLHETAKELTRNLNRVIDVSFNPLEETKSSNLRHRPIGLGCQALHDVFMVLGLPFESEEAAELNANIFETIYHGCVESSIELAMADGPYDSYEGSPASRGLLQFDLWGASVDDTRHDWTKIKADMRKHGLRNSLLTAQMPTASSSSICSGGVESVECQTANIYNRRVLSGEFPVINKHLVKDLVGLGMWNTEMKQAIIRGGGSVQHIEKIPEKIRAVYKTVWEVPQRVVLDQAASRGVFIDQSQSTNVFFERPDLNVLSSSAFYAWKRGLKTGSYYVRTRPVRDSLKFTVGAEATSRSPDLRGAARAPSTRGDGGGDGEACVMCSA